VAGGPGAHRRREPRQASAQTMDLREPFFRRFAIDTNVQIGLGLFFSEKLRAAVLYALYDRTSERAAREAALRPTGQPGTPGHASSK